MIKVTIEKTFNKTPEDAMKCLCALACIEGAILSTAQIIERLGEGGSKTIHIQIEGKARMVFDQIQEALLGNDDFDFRCAETPHEVQVGDVVLILDGANVSTLGIVARICGDKYEVTDDGKPSETLVRMNEKDQLQYVRPSRLQVGDLAKVINPKEYEIDDFVHIDGDNITGEGYIYDIDEGRNRILVAVSDDGVYGDDGERTVVEYEPSNLTVTGRQMRIRVFERADDGITYATNGDRRYPVDELVLDLKGLAIRVVEQEDQIAMAEEEEA